MAYNVYEVAQGKDQLNESTRAQSRGHVRYCLTFMLGYYRDIPEIKSGTFIHSIPGLILRRARDGHQS